MPLMNPLIFREYDIRGRVDQDLTPAHVYRFGRALGVYYRRNGVTRLVVGQDCRLSSPAVAGKMAQALVESGCEIIDLGVCPTPVS